METNELITLSYISSAIYDYDYDYDYKIDLFRHIIKEKQNKVNVHKQ